MPRARAFPVFIARRMSEVPMKILKAPEFLDKLGRAFREHRVHAGLFDTADGIRGANCEKKYALPRFIAEGWKSGRARAGMSLHRATRGGRARACCPLHGISKQASIRAE